MPLCLRQLGRCCLGNGFPSCPHFLHFLSGCRPASVNHAIDGFSQGRERQGDDGERNDCCPQVGQREKETTHCVDQYVIDHQVQREPKVSHNTFPFHFSVCTKCTRSSHILRMIMACLTSARLTTSGCTINRLASLLVPMLICPSVPSWCVTSHTFSEPMPGRCSASFGTQSSRIL